MGNKRYINNNKIITFDIMSSVIQTAKLIALLNKTKILYVFQSKGIT